VVEKLVTLGKRGDPYARRIAISRLRDAALVRKLIGVYSFPEPPRAIS
jgi:large subunit ribosomal protein L17